MICKLCLQDQRLIKESHIIPDFMYREIFDDKHSLIKAEMKSTKLEGTPLFNGEYEGEILCQSCDNHIIGSLEGYAREVLYGDSVSTMGRRVRQPDGLVFQQVEHVDYKRFKLFLLSLLWRASVSSRPFFQYVSLGPYEEKIRRMIFENDPGSSAEFPCIITSAHHVETLRFTIASPSKFRMMGTIGYFFLINGTIFSFLITEKEKLPWILDAAVNEQGEFKIIHATDKCVQDLLTSITQNM